MNMGKVNLTLGTVQKLCKALNCTPSDLMPDEKPPTASDGGEVKLSFLIDGKVIVEGTLTIPFDENLFTLGCKSGGESDARK